MLWLADQRLPPRFDCLEIGSSAGINLMIDRYHYELSGVHVGPQPGAMAFAPEWRGDHPPIHDIEIASLKGCDVAPRSEEHTSELQSLMRISYAVFCLKKKNHTLINH